MHNEIATNDGHGQLRALYMSLLSSQDNFDEFKQLLAMYPTSIEGDTEPVEAASVRSKLNDRIRNWTGATTVGLSASQVLLWRAIVVDERFNVSLSPWKESNSY